MTWRNGWRQMLRRRHLDDTGGRRRPGVSAVAVAVRYIIHYYTLRGGGIQYIGTYMVTECTGTEWRPLFSVRVTEEAVAGVRDEGGW